MPAPLPNLIIAGVNKAGSTSLFATLADHPDVAGSIVKETCHFLPVRYGEPVPSIDEYRSHFVGVADAPVVMEATPGYFYGGADLARHIDEAVPGTRVVLVLREPVARLLSFFRFQKSLLTLPESLDADGYVDACLGFDPDELRRRRELNPWFGVEGGRYDRHLASWLEVFGPRIRVLFFEDLVEDDSYVQRELGAWLGLSAEGWGGRALRRENRTVAPRRAGLHRVALHVNSRLERQWRRHPGLKAGLRRIYTRFNTDPATDDLSAGYRERLSALYREPNREVSALLRSSDVPLPSWLSAPTPG